MEGIDLLLVKIQLTLTSPIRGIFYTRDHSVFYEKTLSAEEKAFLIPLFPKESKNKIFALASLGEDRKLQIEEVVPRKEWPNW